MKYKILIGIIIFLCMIYCINLYSDNVNNIRLNDDPHIFAKNVKKIVSANVAGSDAFKIAEKNKFSCELARNRHETLIICRKTSWLFPIPSFSNHWQIVFIIKQGKISKIETDVFPYNQPAQEEIFSLNSYLLLVLQLWLVYVIIVGLITSIIFLLLRRKYNSLWKIADNLLFIIPYWIYGITIYIAPKSETLKQLPILGTEKIELLIEILFLFSTAFILLAPLEIILLRVFLSKNNKSSISIWKTILFYCIIAPILAVLISLD